MVKKNKELCKLIPFLVFTLFFIILFTSSVSALDFTIDNYKVFEEICSKLNTNWANVVFENIVNLSTTNQNNTIKNISLMSCIIFDSGGKICSGV